MNNDLEQFSEERLEAWISDDPDKTYHVDGMDLQYLARIALAAKQAKPEYYIVRLELNDGWGNETVLDAYESQNDASKCKEDHGGVIIPAYTTTPANSPAIPDGWKLVPIEPTEKMVAFAWRAAIGIVDHGNIRRIYSEFISSAPKLERE